MCDEHHNITECFPINMPSKPPKTKTKTKPNQTEPNRTEKSLPSATNTTLFFCTTHFPQTRIYITLDSLITLSTMKKSGLLAASVAAASATAASLSSSSSSHQDETRGRENSSSSQSSSSTEKFAPRFDGLRFIETLVTAHR